MFIALSPAIMAEDEAVPTPSIYATTTSTYAGNYAYITIKAKDFQKVASLDISLFYDSEIMSVSSSSILSFASGTQYSINSTTPGETHFSMVAVNGLEGSGDIFQIGFKINSGVAAGKYPVIVAAGSAYDATLAPVTMTASNGYVEIKETQQTTPKISFYSSSVYSSMHGDTVKVTFSASDLRSLASADFEFNYDKDILGLENIELGNKLTSAAGAVYSINDNTPGYAKISYIAMNGLTGYVGTVVTLTFKVLANEDTETYVKMRVNGVCDSLLNTMEANSPQATVKVQKRPISVIHPNIYIGSYDGTEEEFSIPVIAEGKTALAAGDFTVEYDGDVFSCVGAINRNGDVLIANTSKSGKVTFSYICESGIVEDSEIAFLTFKKINSSVCSTDVTISGKNLVDANFNSISAEYIPSKIAVHTKGTQVDCTLDKFCTVCNKLIEKKSDHIYDDENDMICNKCGLTKYIPGDMNGDKEVDTDDAIYLLRHVLLSSTYPINQPGDVNGDGALDTDDAIYLLRHVLLPNSYPLTSQQEHLQ